MGRGGGSVPVDFATVERVYVVLEIDASVLVADQVALVVQPVEPVVVAPVARGHRAQVVFVVVVVVVAAALG